MTIITKFALGSSAAALLFTAVAPAHAVAVSDGAIAANVAATIEQDDSDYRRWGRHRHRDRISGDDVLTGIGILAGIAILSDIISSSEKRSQRSRPPEPRDEPVPYPPIAQNDAGSNAGDDIGAAVSACSQAAERSAGGDARVQEIRSAVRDGNSWRVEGQLAGRIANSFSCGFTNGQIDFVKMGSAAI